MEKLRERVDYYLLDLKKDNPIESAELEEVIDSNCWVYPFSEVEVKIAALLSTGHISFEEYLSLKNSYDKRNQFLFTFEMSGPRTFGETWAQSFLQSIVPELSKPSTDLDPTFSGEYDLWYEGIKIEVKASRAVKRKSGGKLIDKALNSEVVESFDMNFQQIKPACCDVFIWMGVWRDTVRYWVLSSNDVVANKYYSTGQHRGNSGEGQLWIKDSNIDEFNIYLTTQENILQAIVEKARK